MDAGEIGFERDDAIAVVTLDRPGKLNALTGRMLDRLAALADRIEDDLDIRAVILTGSGDKAFCAGADIAEWGGLSPLEFGRSWIMRGHRLFDRWARLRQPVIAALNGRTLGGGLELAACADLRIAEAQVTLGLPESRIGIIPGWSGTQRLVRRCGGPVVKRLALTGETVTAEAALRMGLVDEVVEPGQGLVRARELALAIATRAPVAAQIAKQLVNAAEGEETSASIEALAGAFVASTADAREGVAAFKEKRSPSFRHE